MYKARMKARGWGEAERKARGRKVSALTAVVWGHHHIDIDDQKERKCHACMQMHPLKPYQRRRESGVAIWRASLGGQTLRTVQATALL